MVGWLCSVVVHITNPIVIEKKVPVIQFYPRTSVIIRDIDEHFRAINGGEVDEYEELMYRMPDKDRLSWFLSYKEFMAGREDKPETIYDCYELSEIEYLFRTVETETFGCDFDSKCNVASVILNRVDSDRFPSTISGVVTSPSQFVYSRRTISEETVLAVEFAFEIMDTTEGSLYFHSGEHTNTFNGATYVFTDSSGHKFYR